MFVESAADGSYRLVEANNGRRVDTPWVDPPDPAWFDRAVARYHARRGPGGWVHIDAPLASGGAEVLAIAPHALALVVAGRETLDSLSGTGTVKFLGYRDP